MKGGERFMLDVVKNVAKAAAVVVVGYCLAIMMIVAVCDKLDLLEEWFCAHIKWAAPRAALFSSCRLLVRFVGLILIGFANLGWHYAPAVEVDAKPHVVRIDVYVDTRA